jgi:hypothetical protein
MYLNINRKNVLLASVLFVFIAAVLALNQAGLFKNKQANLPPPPKYTKTDLPTDKLPEVFPKDLIQEKNVMVLESYKADVEVTKSESGKTQYTVKYITKNSLDKNFELYFKYFVFNKWVILNQSKIENYATIRVAKGIDSVTMILNVDKTRDLSTVDITFIRVVLNKAGKY